MRRTFIAVLALSGTVAHAEVYRCPQAYPGKDASKLPLTGAFMMWGERPSSGPPYPAGWVMGDEVAALEGLDVNYYDLPKEEPRWLICEYGSHKRIKGRFHNGHEWGQYMQGHGEEVWFMKLAPLDTTCTVQTREIKSGEPSKSTWTVSAVCKRPDS